MSDSEYEADFETFEDDDDYHYDEDFEVERRTRYPTYSQHRPFGPCWALMAYTWCFAERQ